jgi:hypothetical protein
LVIVGLFLLATFIPRRLVPPPSYDLLLSAEGGYESVPARLAVEYTVRGGRVEAIVLPAPPAHYQRPAALFLFDHTSLTAREVPVDLSVGVTEESGPRARPIDALADRRVVTETRSPDGYEFQTRRARDGGLVADLFGMSRSDAGALINRGRVIPIELPAPYAHANARAIGWLVDEP